MSLWKEFRDSLSSVVSFPSDYFAGFFGVAPAESGVQVNELTAMQIAAYVGCVRLISSARSIMPLNVYEITPDGERLAGDHNLFEVLRFNPNDEVSAADLGETGQVHLLMTGNCYLEIAYNGAGQPAGLYLRSPFQTFPYRYGYNSDIPPDLRGKLYYLTHDTPTGIERPIQAADMVHVKGMGMDSLVGLSPVKYYAREVLGTDLAAQSYSAKLFANDSRPGGYLKSPNIMAPDKKLGAIQTWLAGHSRGQAHQMAILDGGLTWEKVGISPDEAQFLETRKFNAAQIGTIFGVPTHFLGESEQSRANMEQRMVEFLNTTIQPWLNKWEMALNKKLFRKLGRNAGRFFCRFDTTEFKRATYSDMLKGVQMGRYATLYTLNEGRKELGLQPYTKKQLTSDDIGDKLLQAVNMVTVTEDTLAGHLPTQVIDSLDKPNQTKGAGGNDQSGGDGGGKPASGTTQGGKRSDQEIKRYFEIFKPTFRDALGRIVARSKADEKDFQRAFSPVLIQIASVFSFRSDAEPGDMVLSESNAQFIREYISTLSQRGKEWTAENADTQAGDELKRAIEVLREKCSFMQEAEDEGELVSSEKAGGNL